MSTDSLAQSLVDAAAEADWQAHHKAILDAIGVRGNRDDKQRRISRVRSRAVLVAILERLAEAQDEYIGTVLGALISVPEMDSPPAKALPAVLIGRQEVAEHFRRLALEIREGR